MAIGTVKTSINWKDSSGKNAGQLFAGDKVLGSVTTVFNFYKIIRTSGKEIAAAGTCALSGLTITDDAPPPPPPPAPAKPVYLTAHYADGSSDRYVPE